MTQVVNEVPSGSILYSLTVYIGQFLWTFTHESGDYTIMTESEVVIRQNGRPKEVAIVLHPASNAIADIFQIPVVRSGYGDGRSFEVELSDGNMLVFCGDEEDDRMVFVHFEADA